MSHTPEPWVLFEVGDRFKHQCPAASSDKTSILTTTEEDGVQWAAVYNDADAHRIVACVNACAGMEDPAEEIAKLKKCQLNVFRAWNSEFNDLVADRDEYRNAVIGMAAMLKNREWANLLSANNSIAELDVQITNLHDELNQEKRDSLDCDDIKNLKLALSWMGCSTPESLEECGALQKRLVRDLIRAVFRQKDAMTRGGAA